PPQTRGPFSFPRLCCLKKPDSEHAPHKPGAFLFYPLHNFHPPSFVVDISSVFPEKMALLRIHSSQFAKTAEEFGVLSQGFGDYLFTLESQNRYYGSLAGTKYGEA